MSPAAALKQDFETDTAADLFATAQAPTADEAKANPAAALRFLFVAPQDCEALDVLLAD